MKPQLSSVLTMLALIGAGGPVTAMTQSSNSACVAGYGAILVDGFPDRERLSDAAFDLREIRPYTGQTSLSQGGRFYSQPGVGGDVEIRHSYNGGLFRRMKVPKDYSVATLSHDGNYAVLVSEGEPSRNPGSSLKLINTASGRVEAFAFRSQGDTSAVRYGFPAYGLFYMQTREAFVLYKLNGTAAFPIQLIELGNAEYDRFDILPVLGTAQFLRSNTDQPPLLVDELKLRAPDNPAVSPDAGNPFFTQNTALLEALRSAHADKKDAGVRGLYLTQSRNSAVIWGGQRNGAGTNEAFIDVIDMTTFKMKQSFLVSEDTIDRIAVSRDEQQLAWASAKRLGILDLGGLHHPVEHDLTVSQAPVVVSDLQWESSSAILTLDGVGRILRWNAEKDARAP